MRCSDGTVFGRLGSLPRDETRNFRPVDDLASVEGKDRAHWAANALCSRLRDESVGVSRCREGNALVTICWQSGPDPMLFAGVPWRWADVGSSVGVWGEPARPSRP